MFEQIKQNIKEEYAKQGISIRDLRITSFDLPKYVNYCYLLNGERIQGIYIMKVEGGIK